VDAHFHKFRLCSDVFDKLLHRYNRILAYKNRRLRRAFLVLRDLCAGALVPLTLFPDFIQKILFFLPFQFVAYVPTRVFIGSYELAGISLSVPCVVGMQAVAVVVMFLVYKLLWYLGIKKFTGVGA